MAKIPRPTLIVVGIVAGMLGALLARQLFKPAEPVTLTHGTVLTPARLLPDFSLVDGDQRAFNRERLTNHWSILFFGFTNCGDVCPLTMTTLAATIKSLSDSPALPLPQVIFVSVDSKRDSPDIVKRYAATFNPSFIGVTGQQDELDAFTKSLGIPSALRPLDNGAYAVDHSAAILVTNPRGELQAIFSPPHTVQGLASDLRILIGASR